MVHDVVVVHPAQEVDRYGNVVAVFGPGSRVSTKGWVSQRSRSEVLNGREAQIQGWVCFLPAGTVVSGSDRVEWSGLVFEVDGPPLPAWSPRGLHHTEVQLRSVEG